MEDLMMDLVGLWMEMWWMMMTNADSWERCGGGKKKVGISSLSKKAVIRLHTTEFGASGISRLRCWN